MPTAADLPDPPAVAIPKGYVGRQWHLAIGSLDGTRLYGYNLVRDNSTPWPFDEDTDTRSRDQLVAATPALTDRDLVTYPRETQGDYSGGGNQYEFIQPNRFFDGNLDIRIPGHLKLSSGWRRVSTGALVGGGLEPQISGTTAVLSPKTSIRSAIVLSFGETDGGWYTYLDGLLTRQGAIFGGQPLPSRFIQADGQAVYISDGLNRIARVDTPNATDGVLASGVGAHHGMWVVDRGSGGYYLYIARAVGGGAHDLQIFDLSVAPPIPPTTLPFGSKFHTIQDVCGFGPGIAILVQTNTGCQVWQSDHTTTSLLADFAGYTSWGLTNSLGTLYITLNPMYGGGPAVLASIASGTVSFLLNLGDITSEFTGVRLGAPTVGGQRIYFTVIPGTIGGLPPPPYAQQYVGCYDTLTRAYSHRSQFDQGGSDLPGLPPRSLLGVGDGVAMVFASAGVGYVQFETSTLLDFNPTSAIFSQEGYLITSRYDFNTPAVSKLLRQLVVRHAPLQTGESLQLTLWADEPPERVYQAAPLAGPVANAVVGSTESNLLFPIASLAKSVFVRVDLFAGGGGSQATTPIIYDISVEIGVPFVWTLTLDCSHDLAQLDQRPDDFKLRGQDRYALLRNAQLNGQYLVLVHPTGVTWKVAVERVHTRAFSPFKENTPNTKQDFESVVEVTLRAVPDTAT
jgi:hypothetical protein